MVTLNISYIESVEIIRSQLMIEYLVLKHMVNYHQERLRYCDNCLLLPTAGDQPIVKGGQIRSFLSNSRPSGFDQISTQPLISLLALAAFPLSRTLVVPRQRPA